MNVALTRARNALFIIGNALTVFIFIYIYSFLKVNYGEYYFNI